MGQVPPGREGAHKEEVGTRVARPATPEGQRGVQEGAGEGAGGSGGQERRGRAWSRGAEPAGAGVHTAALECAFLRRGGLRAESARRVEPCRPPSLSAGIVRRRLWKSCGQPESGASACVHDNENGVAVTARLAAGRSARQERLGLWASTAAPRPFLSSSGEGRRDRAVSEGAGFWSEGGLSAPASPDRPPRALLVALPRPIRTPGPRGLSVVASS